MYIYTRTSHNTYIICLRGYTTIAPYCARITRGIGQQQYNNDNTTTEKK